MLEAEPFLDRSGHTSVQQAQAAAGGGEVEDGAEGDRQERGQVRAVGVFVSRLHGLGEVQGCLRICSQATVHIRGTRQSEHAGRVVSQPS